MILYNSLEVREKLFNFVINQVYYEITAFSYITIALVPVVFLCRTNEIDVCVPDRDP